MLIVAVHNCEFLMARGARGGPLHGEGVDKTHCGSRAIKTHGPEGLLASCGSRYFEWPELPYGPSLLLGLLLTCEVYLTLVWSSMMILLVNKSINYFFSSCCIFRRCFTLYISNTLLILKYRKNNELTIDQMFWFHSLNVHKTHNFSSYTKHIFETV